MPNKRIKNYKSNIKGLGSFYVIFQNSAALEKPGYYGISHLIEHCMCERIKTFELEFEKYGVEFNAATNMNQVCFYISGLDEGIIKFRNLFYNEIINYEITEEVFNREKNVVIQEYRDMISDQQYVFIANVFRKYFSSRFVIGELDDLKNLKYEDFINYKNLYFNAPTKICNTSKKKYKNKKIKFLKKFKNENKLVFNKSGSKIPLLSKHPNKNNRTIGYFNIFNFSNNKDGIKKYIYCNILNDYMCYGLTSPLYKELRDGTGDVYHISSDVDSLYEDGTAVYSIFLTANPKSIKKIKEKLLNCLINNINNLDKNIFDNIVFGIKNDIKKLNLTLTKHTDSFSEHVVDYMKTFKFKFNDFVKYSKTILENDFIILSDEEI